MKQLLTSYVFTPGVANVGTITVAGVIRLEQFLLITNVTSNENIYQFNKASHGGTANYSGQSTVLTLNLDTSGMSASDSLQIFIDDTIGASTALNQEIQIAIAENIRDAVKDAFVNSGLLAITKEDVDTPEGEGINLLLPEGVSPDPQRPSGLALQATLRDPVQLDQTVPAVIGGVDPTGAALRARVGVDGGLQLTDCKILTGYANTINSSPTGWIDTTGYQSIVVTFTGSLAGTVYFQATNDPSTVSSYISTSVVGWALSGSSTPTGSASSPQGTSYQFPVTAKYFRVALGSYTSGVIATTTALRSAPAAWTSTSPVTTSTAVQNNLLYINGNGIGSVGTFVNAPPLIAGGADASGLARRLLLDASGNQQVIGNLPLGYQLNKYNATYGRATQTLVSQTATQSAVTPVSIGGFDVSTTSRGILLDNSHPNLGAVAVTSAPATQAQQSIHDLLNQILATLRAIAHYEYDNGSRSSSDEPDVLIGEYLNQANGFTNLSN